MSMCLSRSLCRVLSRQTASSSFMLGEHHHAVRTPWFASVMTLKTSASLRAEPKKKKKVSPMTEQLQRDRLKKRVRRLEKVPPELIPVEDLVTPVSCLDETRERSAVNLLFEESERRASLLKEWCRYKQEQSMAEMQAVELALKAQTEALEELKLESEELYHASLKPDTLLFPFTHEGPVHTPPINKYEAPDGKYNDITKVYTQ
ncbi:large ribosomal subunit protein mL40 [Notothenia coriiceps]|uniref:Large ribosomal subunit protein mL40 n=1 Tax=Notothenia coriiceps TaxID=8208 RepID=A0A6I9NX17_9TELE|nr:PREDICTED: 39S ribosomal protein L40, mitochondrial [Notothenia coriiceps]